MCGNIGSSTSLVTMSTKQLVCVFSFMFKLLHFIEGGQVEHKDDVNATSVSFFSMGITEIKEREFDR